MQTNQRALPLAFQSLVVFTVLVAGHLWRNPPLNHQYIGKGAASPQMALFAFAEAVKQSEYLAMREFVIYRPYDCLDMDLISLDLFDQESLNQAIVDHISGLDRLKGFNFRQRGEEFDREFCRLWVKRLLPFRRNFLPYIEVFQSLDVRETDSNWVWVSYPKLMYDFEQDSIVPEKGINLSLPLVKYRGKWYVYFFNCSEFGVKDLPPGKSITNSQH